MLDYACMKGGTADAIEVAAPWDCITTVWKKMREALEPLCEEVECHFSHVYHTGASVYVIFHAKVEGDDAAAARHYKKCLKAALETSLQYGGNVSHHHGSGKAKAEFLPKEYGEGGMLVLQKLKQAFDPAGTLNKGVLGL
jgi:alkyldihydroxyacetonephosphate synthase